MKMKGISLKAYIEGYCKPRGIYLKILGKEGIFSFAANIWDIYEYLEYYSEVEIDYWKMEDHILIGEPKFIEPEYYI